MDIGKYFDSFSDYIDIADKKNWFLYAFVIIGIVVIYLIFFQ